MIPDWSYRRDVKRVLVGGGLAAIAIASAILVGESRADLDAQVFTSRSDRLKLIVPRGWVATDSPSYPGLLLSMMRDQPEGRMMLTAEAFTRELYCSWPIACRSSKDPPTTRFACALRTALVKDKSLHVGPVQAGPKENEDGGLASVFFEYDDGKHFVRQAVALSTDRAISLVLVAPTNDARTSHSRAFEQALRTLQTVVESAPEIVVDASVVDALPDDAITPVADAARADAGMFESAPAPKIDPIGTCTEAR